MVSRGGPWPNKHKQGVQRLKRNRIRVVLLAAVMMLSLILAACGTGEQPPADQGSTQPPAPTDSSQPAPEPAKDGPVDGGTLSYGTFAEIVTVNPLFIDDTSSGDLATWLYAPLFSLDSKGGIAADAHSLAAEMPQISADGKTYTIKLKTTPKWTDGTPVTADDVVFTFQAFANPEVGSTAISNFDKLASVKALDSHTVEMVLKDTYSPFETDSLLTPIIPAHVFKDVGPNEMQAHPYGKDLSATVTNGPYKWAEWEQNQHHLLLRDPNYWGPRPHIDQFIYKIYADQQTMVQALLTGDVDMITGIPTSLLDTVKAKAGVAVEEQPGPYYDYLGFNFDGQNFPGGKSPFAGVKTRQALYYAINRKGMVDSILKGHGELLDGPFLSTGWAYTEGAATSFPYDPAKARQLLADDGWTAGPDGILVKDGQKFSFTLQYNAGNARREQLCAVIQQNLKDVGIEVIIEPVEWSSWIENNIIPGKYQAIVLGWQLSIDPNAESIFSSKYYSPNGQNSGWYKNEKTDQLWVDGYLTADKDKRRQLYAEIAREFSADPPYVFLLSRNETLGRSAKIKWTEESAPVLSLPYGYFLHFQDWWINPA